MYHLKVLYDPQIDLSYPSRGWFFGWATADCNAGISPGYTGCDAIFAARSQQFSGQPQILGSRITACAIYFRAQKVTTPANGPFALPMRKSLSLELGCRVTTLPWPTRSAPATRNPQPGLEWGRRAAGSLMRVRQPAKNNSWFETGGNGHGQKIRGYFGESWQYSRSIL